MSGHPKPIAHGTYRGAAQHRRRKEKPCERCHQAERDYRNALLHKWYVPHPRQKGALALARARELEPWVTRGTVQQAAWATGRSTRTIIRYRKLLRKKIT